MRKRNIVGLIGLLTVLLLGVCVVQAATLNLTNIRGTWVYPSAGQRILMAGATAFRAVAPWANGISIGMLIARLLLEDTAGNNANIVPGANAPYPAPPGWPSPNSPPSSASLVGEGTYLGNADVTSCGQLGYTLGAKAWTNSYQYEIKCGVAQGEAGINNCTGLPPSCPGGTFPALVRRTLNCPAGYTLQSGSCNLTDPTLPKWPSDGVPTIEPTGSGWQGHSRDPDPVTPGLIQGPDVVRNGSDEYGNPQRETWHNNGDGTITGKQVTQGQTGDTTNVNEKGIVIGPDGRVTNVTNTTTQNVTINNYTNPVPGGGAPLDLELPDDYAREDTLQQIRDKMSDVPVPPAENQYDSKADGVNTIRDTLQNYTSPEGPAGIQGIFPSAGACQQVHWSFLNKSYAFPGETGCHWFADFKLWFGWALYVMTAIYLYRLASATVGRTR